MEKSECWEVRWSQRNEGFTDKKQEGRPKVLNKTAKVVLNIRPCTKQKTQRGRSYNSQQVKSGVGSRKAKFGDP